MTDGIGIRLAYADTTDYGCIRNDDNPITFETDWKNYTSDAELVHCRIEPHNAIRQYYFINGTYLISEQDTLIHTSSTVNLSTYYIQPSIIESYIQTNQETTVIFHNIEPYNVKYQGEEINYRVVRPVI